MAVCQVNADGTVSLRHYYNGNDVSTLLVASNPTIGFSRIVTSFVDGKAKCDFTRSNSLTSEKKYYNQNGQYYLLSAFGSLDSSGLLNFFLIEFII